jgi:hypothetical protein
MNFFKKIAEAIGKVLQIAGVASGLLQFLPQKQQGVATVAINDLTSVGSVLLMIQTALSTATGADKLKAALPLVVNIVKSSEMVTGHDIADEARFTLGSQEILQGVYDVLNSLKADGVKTSGQALTVVPAASIK